MPAQMVHLKTAYDLLPYLSRNISPPEYYLGAISPDSVHMNEGYTREMKVKSHLHGTPDKMSIENIKKFISELDRKSPDYSFSIGYAVHLLTDYISLEPLSLRDKIVKGFEEDPNPPLKEYSAAYYNDMDVIEAELYSNAPWRREVWQLLADGRPVDFSDVVTAYTSSKWKKRTLEWFDSFDYGKLLPLRYITAKDMDEFYIRCLEFSKKILSAKGLENV